MNNEKDFRKISKFLSLVLRHQPEKIGLHLDENGWVSIEELLDKINQHEFPLTMDVLMAVVKSSDKKRFAFSDNAKRIRANQGHSVKVDLNLMIQEPPEVLYHGTVARHLDAIRQQGLQKQSRHHVHLSSDAATASMVGQRYGKAIVLSVKAKEMHRASYKFYLSENGVWLTDEVPPEFIEDMFK